MGGVSDKGLISAGPWPLGLDNVAREGSMPTDDEGNPIALREAVNIDLDKTGHPRRRPGYTPTVAGSLVHSLWSTPLLPFGLYVDNGQLKALFENGSTEDLATAVGNQPLSYWFINDRVFYSNTAACGLITADLQRYDWAPETPDGQPEALAVAGFGLDPGKYQVAITFTDILGRESGTTLATAVDVPAGHGILLTSIPQPVDAIATPTINFYVTKANDQVLWLYATRPAGITTLPITGEPSKRSLRTQMLVPLPPGQFVGLHSGRQMVASGRSLRWSPVQRYGLTNPTEDVMHYVDPIDLVAPVGTGGGAAGVYVAAGSRTYYHGGADPSAFTRKIVAGHGAVPGTCIWVPGTKLGLATNEDVPVWLSKNGHYCAGLEGGSLMPIKEGEIAIHDATRGASLYRERNGIQQIVTTLKAPRKQGLSVTDRAVAHVIHEDPA